MSPADALSDQPPAEGRQILGVGRHDVRQFVLYGLNGLLTAVVYTAVVWTLLAVSHRTFVLDVVLAYAASVVSNYFGARRLFKPTTTISGHIGRYLVVVIGSFALTSIVAWLLHRAGAPDIIGAYLPVAVTTIPTFLVMRRWVFSSPEL